MIPLLLITLPFARQKSKHWEQLPPVGAATSRCHAVHGFVSQDVFPTRSPLVVADQLIPLVEGKAFAEVGTRNGDIMGCVSNFAKSVTAIELDHGACKAIRKRGFGIICRDFMSLRPHEFPRADVLYWWPQLSWEQNEAWMLHAMRAYEALNQTVRVVVGFDSHWAADMVSLTRMMKRFRGMAVQRLFFDEGGTWQDMFSLMNHEFRPGHWGVFHLAHFTIGAGGAAHTSTISPVLMYRLTANRTSASMNSLRPSASRIWRHSGKS